MIFEGKTDILDFRSYGGLSVSNIHKLRKYIFSKQFLNLHSHTVQSTGREAVLLPPPFRSQNDPRR